MDFRILPLCPISRKLEWYTSGSDKFLNRNSFSSTRETDSPLSCSSRGSSKRNIERNGGCSSWQKGKDTRAQMYIAREEVRKGRGIFLNSFKARGIRTFSLSRMARTLGVPQFSFHPRHREDTYTRYAQRLASLERIVCRSQAGTDFSFRHDDT